MMKNNSFRSVCGIVLAGIILGLAFDSNADLSVVDFKGNVVIEDHKGVHQVKRHLIVGKKDMLNIPTFGKVKIRDSQTKGVYSNISSGSISVENLIKYAYENSKNNIGRINGRIKKEIQQNSNSDYYAYNRMGVSHRYSIVEEIPIKKPDSISFLSYIMNLDYDVFKNDVCLSGMFLNQMDSCEVNSGIFYFVVSNKRDNPLYFNVIDYNFATQDKIQFYFPENLIVMPHDKMEIKDFEFFSTDGDGYILIATEKDFSIEDVERLLEKEYEPTDEYFFSVIEP